MIKRIAALSFFLFLSMRSQAASPLERCLQEIPGRHFQKMVLKEAQGFHYYKKGSHFLLETDEGAWLLSPEEKVPYCSSLEHIQIPVKRAVTFSTTHLAFLEELQKMETLVGFSGFDLVNNSLLLLRYKEGKVKELGYPAQLEKLISLKPQVVFSYSVQKNDEEEQARLKKLKLPLISVGEYKEKTPLARAEWLVFFSLFYNQEKLAQEIYLTQHQKFSELSKKARLEKVRPLVMTGELRGGVWYASGAETDLVRLIEDAGGEYLWKAKGGKRYITLSFEEVLLSLKKAKRPVIWFPQNTWTNLKDLEKADPRYKTLQLISQTQIYNSNLKRNAKGYSDYWEGGLAHPEKLLEELISIFHPTLLPNYKRTWFWDMKGQ